tara:strand:- start:1091 stop:2125 length:1035 start_codon:yes stop_codon:yes gene_type:complete
MSLGKFADDVLGIDPGGGGIVGSVKNVADDVLGIDPSGEGLVGSIRDNPRTAAVLGSLLIPGVGSAITSGLGAAGSALGSGLSALGGLGSSALGAVGGLSGLGGLLGNVAPLVAAYGLTQTPQQQIPPQGFYNMPGMGGGLLGGGAPIGQSAFDYARSIAGGMPFEQVVQPGRDFSLESPMGEPVIDRTIPPSPGLPVLPPPVFRPLPFEPITPVAPQPPMPMPMPRPMPIGERPPVENRPPMLPEEPIYTLPGTPLPIEPSKGVPELTPMPSPVPMPITERPPIDTGDLLPRLPEEPIIRPMPMPMPMPMPQPILPEPIYTQPGTNQPLPVIRSALPRLSLLR